MEGDDEILFSGEFKDFSLNVRYSLKSASELEVSGILASTSELIDEAAFKFSEIKTKQIEDLIKLNGSGLNSVISFLSSIKPNDLRQKLIEASSKELLPATESYFFQKLFQKANLPTKLIPKMFAPSIKPEKEEAGQVMVFVGKYKNWIAIKKLSIDKTTKDWEVSGLLSGINNTIINKAFDFAGVDRTKLDSIIAKICTGKRKSYNNAADALKSLQLTSNQKDDAYLICKTLETLGYKPYSSPEMLTGAHPEIKPPKVKGRKPKG
ncbi:DUF2666 family protein [Candidatus Micrarchaeota archaeon]|nr:DUF2666 family protein [Candidatus Micrarchaeota archaeon]